MSRSGEDASGWSSRLAGWLTAAAMIVGCAGACIAGPPLLSSTRPAAVRTSTPAMPITRSDVLARARGWIEATVPYSMEGQYGGYRTDCSGFVSMAWRAENSYTTRSLRRVTHEITKEKLKPGDALLWRKTYGDQIGHVRLFGGWLDAGHERYWVYEQAASAGRAVRGEYTWPETAQLYRPIRYNLVVDDP